MYLTWNVVPVSQSGSEDEGAAHLLAHFIQLVRSGDLSVEAALFPVEPGRWSCSGRVSDPVFGDQPGGDRQGRRVSVLRNRDFPRFSGKYGVAAYVRTPVQRGGGDPAGCKAVRAPVPDSVYSLCAGGRCAADVQIKINEMEKK